MSKSCHQGAWRFGPTCRAAAGVIVPAAPPPPGGFATRCGRRKDILLKLVPGRVDAWVAFRRMHIRGSAEHDVPVEQLGRCTRGCANCVCTWKDSEGAARDRGAAIRRRGAFAWQRVGGRYVKSPFVSGKAGTTTFAYLFSLNLSPKTSSARLQFLLARLVGSKKSAPKSSVAGLSKTSSRSMRPSAGLALASLL